MCVCFFRSFAHNSFIGIVSGAPDLVINLLCGMHFISSMKLCSFSCDRISVFFLIESVVRVNLDRTWYSLFLSV